MVARERINDCDRGQNRGPADNDAKHLAGFGLKPAQGDWRRLRRHLEENLANGDAKVADYILNWTAHGYQRSGLKRGVCVVLQGGEGVGKGLWWHVIRRSYGPHGIYVAQPSHLTGKFNSHLWTVCFIFADEAFFAGDVAHESILKSLLTDPTLRVEPKGVNSFEVPNFLDVGMASNDKWVVPVRSVANTSCRCSRKSTTAVSKQ